MIVLSPLDLSERRICARFFICPFSCCALPRFAIDSVNLPAQTAGENTTRQRAFELFKQDKHLEALPLFEELALKSPDDRDVLVGLGVCLVSEAATLDDQDAASKERVRARQVLLKAKKLGSTSPLLENLLQLLPEDGVVKYEKTPADQAMRAAEAAFARHDFEEAIKNYTKVLEYDPKNYSAVLFIGDSILCGEGLGEGRGVVSKGH